MCCKIWKTFLPFIITFLIGNLITITIQSYSNPKIRLDHTDGKGSGGGSGGGYCATTEVARVTNSKTNPLQITLKPRPNYTDDARNNLTQGVVTLRVTFLANGTIGTISTVNNLPNGLTEQAIEAAKSIRFSPATKDGKAITVIKLVQYNFTIY